jgi:hypothetical protein
MGTIISQKVMPDNKIKIRVEVDMNEALALKGNVKDVHIFSRELSTTESKIIEKGKKGVTKYFLIPPKFRKRSKKILNNIACQKIETDTKAIFIYTMNKEQFSI